MAMKRKKIYTLAIIDGVVAKGEIYETINFKNVYAVLAAGNTVHDTRAFFYRGQWWAFNGHQIVAIPTRYLINTIPARERMTLMSYIGAAMLSDLTRSI